MKKVCIIDDNQGDAYLLSELLEGKFDVTLINPSKKILESLEVDYDIYFIDINMGALSGYDTLRYVPSGKKVYMISGMARDYLNSVKETLSDKISGVLSKSNLEEELCQVI